MSLLLRVPNESEARSAFDALTEGGKVEMPLAKTFYSPSFGMVTDRFGVMWMVLTAPKAAAEPRPAGKPGNPQAVEAK